MAAVKTVLVISPLPPQFAPPSNLEFAIARAKGFAVFTLGRESRSLWLSYTDAVSAQHNRPAATSIDASVSFPEDSVP
jgi:hypothetical protein